MSEEAMREVLDSLAKIGKQWGLGESVGRVWGFLLFKSCPVTQREIQEGMGYSRGLISRCLRHLKLGPMYLLNNLWIKIPNYKSQMSNNTQCQNPNVQNTVAKGLF